MMNRRRFLKSTSLGVPALPIAATVLTGPRAGKAQPSERLQIGCVGVGGRAAALLREAAGLPEVDVVAICDIDSRRIPEAVSKTNEIQGKSPQVVKDFRNLLEDSKIDAVLVGTPDHWHAIPTILACQAGKDVYVEKPDGHNMLEGQRMVQVMRRHQRIVQLGTQARTSPHFHSAMEFIRTGRLGKCLVAKAWESARQGSIGRPPDGTPPAGVDYDLWLGPAPKRPFNPRRFHGSWRWFFDYGTGDLGNDGVHRLDIARWALSTAVEAQGEPALKLPSAIVASGGKWYFDDLQEWPDTLQVTYEFDGQPGKLITYEMRIWTPYPMMGQGEGVVVYGDQASIVIGNRNWQAFAPDRTVLAEDSGSNDSRGHMQNFVDCVKSRAKPNADLETVGHPSSVLCHAGNISWRTGQKLILDPTTETFKDAPEANALRTRKEYRKPWVLPEA